MHTTGQLHRQLHNARICYSEKDTDHEADDDKDDEDDTNRPNPSFRARSQPADALQMMAMKMATMMMGWHSPAE